ncbi:TrkH family potassium uptake protein [Myroides sp. LJL110]
MKKVYYLKTSLGNVLKPALILAIILIVTMLGFGFPNQYKPWISLFFIFILAIGILKTILKYTTSSTQIMTRVFVFDLLSIVFICFCVFTQLYNYPLYKVSVLLQVAIFVKLIREFATPSFTFKRSYITPPQLFVISFFLLVFTGTFLLLLPKSTNIPIGFLDALFSSTSAVCVTGLTVVDVSSTFTLLGQSILLILIQLGGLGILTFAAYIAYFFKGNSSFEYQITLGNIANNDAFSDVFLFLGRIIFISISIELLGAGIIFISLDQVDYSVSHKIFIAIFHSVSAFCNAGFSTLPSGMMNTIMINNYNVQVVLIALIFLGGIGFPILVNILKYIKYVFLNFLKKLFLKKMEQKTWVFTLNSKVNLITSLLILGISSLIIYFEEFSNTLSPHSTIGKMVTATFTSMTARTAGFNTIDFAELKFSTIILIILLMWIGASPTSTGGGIKTSTFALAILNFINIARGKQEMEIFNRRIDSSIIKKAFATMTLSFLVIGSGIFLLSKFDSQLGLVDIAFEVFSAYSTVGLSLNITGLLSEPSKLVLIIVMFIGRVSMITILTAFFKKSSSLKHTYPSGDILI